MVSNHDLHPQDLVVAPGFLVRQYGGRIHVTYPNKKAYFSVECDVPLCNFRIHDRKCFAYDKEGRAYIFPFDQSQPTVVSLPKKPHGWCVVPNTKHVLHWNILSLVATNTCDGTHETLRGHLAKVTCGDASTAVVATGDRGGHLCIWYVASWKCHHYIKTGRLPCDQVSLNKDERVAVRTTEKILIFDVTTGKPMFEKTVRAKNIQWCSFGLVVATSTQIHVYSRGELVLSFTYVTDGLIPSVSDRVWSVQNRNLHEFRFRSELVQWPAEIDDWITAPFFPSPRKHWPKRYLDVLAMAAKQWVPRVPEWDPPKIWFRHLALRNAIWDAVLDVGHYEATKAWSFLPSSTLRVWYEKCETKLSALVENDEYSEQIVELLTVCYRHLELQTGAIVRWCWYHHGRVKIRHILMHFTENDIGGQCMRWIVPLVHTQDSISCFSATGARLAIDNGFFLVFIRWLLDFHSHYPQEPTHHMKEIYATILRHVYRELSSEKMDIPLCESGRFVTPKRITLAHRHAYVRHGGLKGFITEVHVGGEPRVEWRPLDTSLTIQLDTEEIEVWTYYDADGPHTMLECALALLDEDAWSNNRDTKPWAWFDSEMGAFSAVGEHVRVFDEIMRIEKTQFDKDRNIVTDTKLTITDSEIVDMVWLVKMWSYVQGNMYLVAPLRLKICHCLSLATRKIHMNVTFAAEILHCCVHETIRKEREWRADSHATAMVAGEGGFYVGSKRGIIYEYANMTSMDHVRRTFESHTGPILQMHTMSTRLVSICDDQLNVWNLRTGTNIMTLDTDNRYVAILPHPNYRLWVVDEHRGRHIITLWDIFSEIPVRHVDTTDFESGSVLTTCEPVPTILIENTIYILDTGKRLHVKVPGDITCIAGTGTGTCGGTSEGVVFAVDHETGDIKTCEPSSRKCVSAIATVPETNTLIIGHVNGTVSVWDIDRHDFAVEYTVGKSPIHYIHAGSLFVMVACERRLCVLSVVRERALLSVHALNTAIGWSHPWKRRLLKDTKRVIQPSVVACLTQGRAVAAALALLDECTEEYHHRGPWCSHDFIEILLGNSGVHAHKILHRLASFRGPRFDCAICSDEETLDTICYLKTCQHRFHTECIRKLIKKTPEYHDQMQYEYALTVALRCPICRGAFTSEDVVDDTLLNKYLYIPYTSLNA